MNYLSETNLREPYTGTEDNGGVHINSGIPNFAFYKFATETGKPKAEKVYYRALTNYLTAKSPEDASGQKASKEASTLTILGAVLSGLGIILLFVIPIIGVLFVLAGNIMLFIEALK